MAVISSVDDPRLTTLSSLAGTVFKMKEAHGKRKQQVTSDTCMSFVHTCHGVVALTKYSGQLRQPTIFYGNFLSLFDYLMIIQSK